MSFSTNVSEDIGSRYSVPDETRKLFFEGILRNPLIGPNLPVEASDCAQSISFVGSSKPSIPINWRFAESVAALKGIEATLILVLLRRKFGVQPKKVQIDTDHAQLFFMSGFFWTIDPDGAAITPESSRRPKERAVFERMFPEWDKHQFQDSFHRALCTNIYKTKDGRFFHLHGSLNPDPSLDSIGLPHNLAATTYQDALQPYMKAIAQITSEDMQSRAANTYRQAGTICWTKEEYKASEHGKANAHVGLYEIHHKPSDVQEPCWWPDPPEPSAKRPLAGLKVVDLTRIIAGPAVGKGLAEFGASVMRVTAPHLTDASVLHVDMNWGKWNSCLDFRQEADREAMRGLILEADIVVSGYRPGVLDKYGFGADGIFDLCKSRRRGIIVVRENCYGWYGPWAGRSGWQQISDACCGVSTEFGRAMGHDEPVTPVFPNSDYCTGIAGVAGAIDALLKRSTDGGSYLVDIALNYYSQWLVNSCGTYPSEVWQELWAANGRPVFRHYDTMFSMLPRFFQMLRADPELRVMNPKHFEKRHSKAINCDILTVKPVITFPNGEVEPGFQVGTRSNGVDAAKWPVDLKTEIVVGAGVYHDNRTISRSPGSFL